MKKAKNKMNERMEKYLRIWMAYYYGYEKLITVEIAFKELEITDEEYAEILNKIIKIKKIIDIA